MQGVGWGGVSADQPVVWGQTVNMRSLCEYKLAGEGLEKPSQAAHSAGRGPGPAWRWVAALKGFSVPGEEKHFSVEKCSSASLRWRLI